MAATPTWDALYYRLGLDLDRDPQAEAIRRRLECLPLDPVVVTKDGFVIVTVEDPKLAGMLERRSLRKHCAFLARW